MNYNDDDIFLVKGSLVVLLFNRSGVQNRAFMDFAHEYGFDITVVSIDIQDFPTSIDRSDLSHMMGQWSDKLQDIKKKYGRAPDIIISNSPCTWNTYMTKVNHGGDGGDLPGKEVDRMHNKEEWIKTCFEILTMKVPVVIAENPRGFMDRVITYRDGAKSFVEVNPWNFVDRNALDERDLHDKRTHLFSGGCMHAIEEYPLTRYITESERLDGVERGWCMRQITDAHDTASNKRSMITPGMARMIAQCAIDRLICTKSFPAPFRYAEFKYDRYMINPPTKDGKLCNKPLAGRPGECCNLRYGHDNKADNHKRGIGNACGIFDYRKRKYIFMVPEPKKRECTAISNPILDPLPELNALVTKKVYLCSQCRAPKKGHKCMKSIQSKVRKVYTCSICKKPKKGHVCRL